jgi:hypothetical protein
MVQWVQQAPLVRRARKEPQVRKVQPEQRDLLAPQVLLDQQVLLDLPVLQEQRAQRAQQVLQERQVRQVQVVRVLQLKEQWQQLLTCRVQVIPLAMLGLLQQTVTCMFGLAAYGLTQVKL